MEEKKKVEDTSEKVNDKAQVSNDESKTEMQNVKIEAQAVKEDVTDAVKETKDKNEVKSEEKKDSNIDIVDVNELEEKKKLEEQRNLAIQRQHQARKKKKTKKLIRWIVILVILGFLIWIGSKYVAYSMLQLTNYMEETQTGQVERKDISETITTTGTVQSKDVRTITSANTGVTIEKVNFEVGDFVNEGDVIVEFSREDIEKNINRAEEDLAEARASESLKDKYMASDNSYDHNNYAYTTVENSLSTAQSLESLNQAKQNLSQACEDKSRFVDKYNTAVNNLPIVQQEYDEASAYKSLFTSVSSQPGLVSNEFPGWGNNDKEIVINYLNYQYTLDEFNNYLSDLNTKINEYKNTINSYDSQLPTYDKAITSAQQNVDRSQLSYESALVAESNRNNSAAKSNNTSDYNYDAYLISRGDSVTKAARALEEQQDKLDDYVVYAPISGVVTSVTAQEGNGYVNTSGGLMTIQAVDTYEISTQIDEYDINSVSLGQRVVIKTDATGDDVLEGIVSFISPISTSASSTSTSAASASSGSSSSSNTYEVRIDIISNESRIKLGMSAKLNIIIDEHSNVLTVPYDAIEEGDDGQFFVTVVPADAVANKKDGDNKSEITVVGTDGKVTGAPENKDKKDKKNKDDKDGFIKYLFSSKDKEQSKKDTGLSAAGKKIVVQVGIEDDYSTEVISNELVEGDAVILNSDDSNPLDDFMMMGGY